MITNKVVLTVIVGVFALTFLPLMIAMLITFNIEMWQKIGCSWSDKRWSYVYDECLSRDEFFTKYMR